MSFVVAAFSLAIIVIGALGLASPSALTAFVRHWQTRSGMWMAAAFRVTFGIALWLAAPSSRFPVLLAVFGALSVVSGVVLPLLGLTRLDAIVSWWVNRSATFKRMWAGVAVLVGGFLLWAVTTEPGFVTHPS
jgi:hypothetical protein